MREAAARALDALSWSPRWFYFADQRLPGVTLAAAYSVARLDWAAIAEMGDPATALVVEDLFDSTLRDVLIRNSIASGGIAVVPLLRAAVVVEQISEQKASLAERITASLAERITGSSEISPQLSEALLAIGAQSPEPFVRALDDGRIQRLALTLLHRLAWKPVTLGHQVLMAVYLQQWSELTALGDAAIQPLRLLCEHTITPIDQCVAFARVAGPLAAPVLCRWLRHHREENLPIDDNAIAAIQALRLTGGPLAAEELERQLTRGFSRLLGVAAEVLVDIGGVHTAGHVLQALGRAVWSRSSISREDLEIIGRAAERALGIHGFWEIVHGLVGVSEAERAACIDKAVYCGDSIIEPLSALLKASPFNFALRCIVVGHDMLGLATALARLGDDDGVVALLRVADGMSWPGWKGDDRTQALRDVAEWLAPGLVAALDSPHAPSNIGAVRSICGLLGEVRYEPAVTPLASFLGTSWFASVLDALINIGRPSLSALHAFLSSALVHLDTKDYYRSSRLRAVVDALAKIGDPTSGDVIESALKDVDPDVRCTAAKALQRLGWKPAGDVIEAHYAIAVGDRTRVLELGASADEALRFALENRGTFTLPFETACGVISSMANPWSTATLVAYYIAVDSPQAMAALWSSDRDLGEVDRVMRSKAAEVYRDYSFLAHSQFIAHSLCHMNEHGLRQFSRASQCSESVKAIVTCFYEGRIAVLADRVRLERLGRWFRITLAVAYREKGDDDRDPGYDVIRYSDDPALWLMHFEWLQPDVARAGDIYLLPDGQMVRIVQNLSGSLDLEPVTLADCAEHERARALVTLTVLILESEFDKGVQSDRMLKREQQRTG